MNRKSYASILALIFLSLAFLAGCNNSKSTPPVETMVAQSGTPQSAAAGAAFAAPLVAMVTTGGTPTSGVSVTFTAPDITGASGTFANGTATETDTTDVNGLATSTTFTADTISGAYTVTATATSLPTVNFSLTNTPVPATITAVDGTTPQSATVLTAFATPLAVLVLDVNSAPVTGASVVFTAPALTGASGTFANGTITETDATDSTGTATASAFTANALAGGYTVTAVVGALEADFSLTNTAGGTVVAITATGGLTQSAAVNAPFGVPLQATVTVGGVLTQGLTVTFTAPATEASGTFASNSTNTETQTTDVNGVATSSTFTANATAGGPYTVTAAVTGATAPANFSLTNTPVAAMNNYSFYLTGLDVQAADGNGPYLYAVAGSVTIDLSGNVVAGEQDYNDGVVVSQTDTIAAGTAALVVDPTTGQGTLTLTTTDTNVGVAGVETLGVQFVNTNHALIVQFDGSATSSGSLDLQTSTNTPGGNYAFTFSGVDTSYNPVVYGGVYSASSGGITGFYDVDDAGTVTLNTAFTGTATTPDSFGRGTVTGTPFATTLAYYVVGPEAIRFIDIDPLTTGGAGVGSAFGQGTGTFSGASLGNSVFGLSSNSFAFPYAAAGVLTTTGNGSFGGTADSNEEGVVIGDSSINGVYTVPSNGYGTMTINGLGDIVNLGIYLTDPALNLNDPNNAAGGGGALIADFDGSVVGTGVLTPQTDTTAADFTGNYAFGAQVYDPNWEFDFVGQGSVTAGALAGTGLVSDPFTFFTGDAAANTAVPFAGTATPDGVTAGRYTIPLIVTVVSGSPVTLNAVIYQASAGQLTWVGVDPMTDLFLGSLEQQGSLTNLPAAKKGAAKTSKKRTK